MTLPNFLGLGVQRSGTSWLYSRLKTHPDIYLPSQRKEIHYFDKFYQRGVKWYSKYLPTDSQAEQFKAIGEITPCYFFDPKVPERIYNLIPDCRFILILRNPADRIYSHYLLAYGKGLTQGDLSNFINNRKRAFPRGLYSDQLERYLEYFTMDNFKILIFEELFHDEASRQSGLESIARFLEIDETRFPVADHKQRVNAGHGPPTFRNTYGKAIKFKRWLRNHDMDWIINYGRTLGVKRSLFGQDRKTPEFKPEERNRLIERYEPSIRTLESYLGRDLDIWLSH